MRSDLWNPLAPEALMASLQRRLAAPRSSLLMIQPAAFTKMVLHPEDAGDPCCISAESSSELANKTCRTATSFLKGLLQLCTALAIVRRTAVFLSDFGIRVAFLYLNHMLEKIPR